MSKPNRAGPALRCYQQKLCDELIAAMDGGMRPLGQAPTGSGKSHILAAVAREAIERSIPVVIACHRREIFADLQQRLSAYTGVEPELCDADHRHTDWSSPLVLCMMPTLSRRLKTTPNDRRNILLAMDEGHHASSPTWRASIDHLAPAHLCGVTATPVSGSSTPLSAVYDHLAVGPASSWLVDNQHLAPCRLFVADRVIDTKDVRIRNGEFRSDDLEAPALELLGHVVPTWRLHAEGMPTLAACVSVKHAKETAAMFQSAGVSAAFVDGSMPMKERDQILADFSNGTTTVLAFCSLIDEGFDCPEARCLLALRPTKSIRLRRQQEGRIRRFHADKPWSIIVDFTNAWQDLPLPDEEILWKLDCKNETGARRLGKVAPKKVGREVTMVEATFHEVTTNIWPPTLTPPQQKVGKGCLIRLKLDSKDREEQDWVLRQVAHNQRFRYRVTADLDKDRGATLRHYALIGAALGHKEGAAHHSFRRAVALRSNERIRMQLQKVVDEAMRRSARPAVEIPDDGILRSAPRASSPAVAAQVLEQPHHLEAVGWAGNSVVIAFGPEGERPPAGPWEHAAILSRVRPILEAAFPGHRVELVGLWGDMALPALEPEPSFEALV
jgi:superfamily II DNA or RNA helicase